MCLKGIFSEFLYLYSDALDLCINFNFWKSFDFKLQMRLKLNPESHIIKYLSNLSIDYLQGWKVCLNVNCFLDPTA